MVIGHPQPNVAVRLHTKERWELSKDFKTLTIQTDVDFPDQPAAISNVVAGDPQKQKYIRVETR